MAVAEALCGAIDDAFARQPELARRFPDCPAARGGGTAGLMQFVNDRPGHDWRYAIDPAKALAQLGWRPGHGFADGLANTVRWYLDHESWWRPLVRA